MGNREGRSVAMEIYMFTSVYSYCWRYLGVLLYWGSMVEETVSKLHIRTIVKKNSGSIMVSET